MKVELKLPSKTNKKVSDFEIGDIVKINGQICIIISGYKPGTPGFVLTAHRVNEASPGAFYSDNPKVDCYLGRLHITEN